MTTLFTPEQRLEVNKVLDFLVKQTLTKINAQATVIRGMDQRPVGVYDPTDPDDGPEKHHFPYVAQAILEEVIEQLQEQV